MSSERISNLFGTFLKFSMFFCSRRIKIALKSVSFYFTVPFYEPNVSPLYMFIVHHFIQPECGVGRGRGSQPGLRVIGC